VSEATLPIGPILASSTVLNNSEKKREVKLMKKLLTVTTICVAVMLAVAPLASGQGPEQKGPPPGGPPAGGPPPGGPPQGGPPAGGPPAGGAQAERIFQGQLVKVDAQAKSISVKGPGDKEMQFDYTDATQVVGEKNVQGLAGKTGADLRVTYRDAGGKLTATKIETIEKGEKGKEK
jgi:hypothetical protein